MAESEKSQSRQLQLLVFAAILALASCAWAQAPVADTVIVNARVYTVNPKQPWAEAVAVRGDKILAVGSSSDVAAYRAASTKTINAGGKLILPGFTDCHIHFIEGSLNLQYARLDDATTIAEVQKIVKEYARQHPDSPWILGRGWQYPIFGAAVLPDKKYLDEIIPDRPVYLTAYDGHTWWANSKALQMAGVTRSTADPPNGSLVRDPSTGEPTGAVREDAADEIFLRVIPFPSRDERLQALRLGLREANKTGLVRVHSAGGVDLRDSDLQNVELYDELRKNGELSVRMYMAYHLDPPALTHDSLLQIEAARARYHDEWISAGAVKFFLDGVIEPHTAAMLTPYSDDPTQMGKLFWSPEQYSKAVTELDREGFQVFTHAIGDKAVRVALDGYEQAAKANHTSDARDRVEHIETISAQDIPRFGQLGVIASFQPLHAYPNSDTLDVWARNVGPDRVSRAWAWHSVESSGGRLAFGSDWPVVTLSPWPGVQNALTRKTTEGNPPAGFVPGERISLEDAIKAYTLGAAFAGHREKTEGSIEPGKLADLIVLDRDLFKIESSKIADTQVLLTMVGGRVVYHEPTWAATAVAEMKP